METSGPDCVSARGTAEEKDRERRPELHPSLYTVYCIYSLSCCVRVAMASLRGIYFLTTLFLGSFFGSVFMLAPFLPLMLVSPAWYRWLTDRIVATWLTLPVALLEIVFGAKVVITGDGFIPGERSVIIMNHRTRLDWMFLWNCLLRYSYLRLEKICLKATLKAVPGFGQYTPSTPFSYPHWNIYSYG
ncbi:UNVERIFIED_CONTAM: hypothetical protein FKN15_051395 [Acipenser sinensis]